MAYTGRDNRKSKPAGRPLPKPAPPPRPDAGPRPLSNRQNSHLQTQREHLSHLHAAHASRPEAMMNRTVVSVHRQPTRPHAPQPAPAVRPNGAPRPRYGAATAARARSKKRANRKNVDWPKVLLNGALVVLAVEVVAAVVLSPRLWIRTVTFEGNSTVATAQLTKRLGIAPQTNVLKLLLERNKLAAALKAEPTVEAAVIRPASFDGLHISIHERTPFAAVKLESAPGRWYTIDKNRVPFRAFDGMPEASLPLVTVATDGSEKVILGKTLNNPGLADVGDCLIWSKREGDAFPVEKVTIDSAGKLCLNRTGGMTVLLGPGMDLKEKLSTLSLLLTKRTDLRGSAPSEIAAVNLYAYDAPALIPKPGVNEGTNNSDTSAQP